MVRSSLLRTLLLAGAMVCGAAVSAHAEGGLHWLDWNAGVKDAEATKRPMLVDVYTDWCGWCKRMDKDVYARPEVREYLSKRFVTVRLDAENEAAAQYEGRTYSYRTLAARFRVTGYPTTIFLRPGGEHIANVPGYVPADRFLLLLRYIGDGHLDRGVTFESFSQQAQK
jgi:thioredoxin-related protein